MNIPKTLVTRLSQVEQGACYEICNDPSESHADRFMIIPPQFFRVETPILRSEGAGRPFVRGTSIVYLGEKLGSRTFRNSLLFLDSVGVYEGHSSVKDLDDDPLTHHIIDSDLHLERYDDRLAEAIGKLLNDESWTQMVRRNGRVAS